MPASSPQKPSLRQRPSAANAEPGANHSKWLGVMVAAAAALLAGCVATPPPTGGFAACEEGATKPCSCEDGSKSNQTCVDGEFDECACPASADGSGADAGPLPDVAPKDSAASGDSGLIPDQASLPDLAQPDAVIVGSCSSDKDCKAASKVCDPLTKLCVACLTDSECSASQHCVGLTCQTYAGCSNSLGCKAAKGPDGKDQPICDQKVGECTACLSAADCPASHDCKAKQCVSFKTCQNSTDCGKDQVCNKATNRCVQCLGDNDCGANHLCEDGKCQAFVPCSSDKQCTALGLLCDGPKGKCAQCLQNGDCPTIYNCQGVGVAKTGLCVLDVCAQGQGACSNNGNVTCNPIGDGYGSPVPCPGQTTCVAPGGKPVCKAWACQPGANCVGDKAVECSGDGLEIVKSTDCAATSQKCIGGSCKSLACAPNSPYCDGNAVKQCAADGLSGAAVKTCAVSEYCDGGACKAQVCSPDQPACDGNVVKTCTANGSGFAAGAGQDCGSQKCLNGVCKSLVCTQNAAYCDGNTVKKCAADGLSGSVSKTCDGSEYCYAGACKPQVCVPSQPTCDGNVVENCNANGSGYVAGAGQDCGSQKCVAGICKTKVCVGATQYCEAGKLKTCSPDGFTVTKEQSCGAGNYCGVSKAGDAACLPVVCDPGQPACNGNNAAPCNADGSGYQAASTNCADKKCVQGVCKSLVCAPALAFCTGQLLKACAADGLSATTTKTCGSAEFCSDDGKGGAACKAQVCAPGKPACDGNKATTCNASGSGYAGGGTDCADKKCDAGLCKAQVCAANTVYCDLAKSSEALQCNASGTSATGYGTCPVDTYCTPFTGKHPCDSACGKQAASGCWCDDKCAVNGDCCGPTAAADDDYEECAGSTCGACNLGLKATVICSQQICAPGKPACDGPKATTCNASGSGFSGASVDCAATAKSCAAGVCAAQVCGNGVVEGTEGCDDANTTDGDACSNGCLLAACGALAITAGGKVTVADSPKLTLSGIEFTVEVWLRVKSPISGAQILGHDEGGGDTKKWFLGYGKPAQSLGKLALFFHVNPGDHYLLTAPYEFPVGLWVHVAVARKGNNWLLFINGKLTKTESSSVAMPDPASPFQLGVAEGAGSDAWPGEMRQVRLSSAQRYATDFVPAPGFSSDAATMALWKLQDGAGAKATDSGPNGLHGELVGSASWAGGSCTVCPASQAVCLGAIAGTCNAQGSGLVSATDCNAQGKTCSAGQCLSGFVSCKAVLNANAAATDGVFPIDPDGAGPVAAANLYCDMKNGGWTLAGAAIGGKPPASDWNATTGVSVASAGVDGATFRLSDAFITALRAQSQLLRYTKSHGVTAFGVPPTTFNSNASQTYGPTQASNGPPTVCADAGMSVACAQTWSNDDTVPWGTHTQSGWVDQKIAVFTANGSFCKGKFGVTDRPCNNSNWNDPTIWLKLWLGPAK